MVVVTVAFPSISSVTIPMAMSAARWPGRYLSPRLYLIPVAFLFLSVRCWISTMTAMARSKVFSRRSNRIEIVLTPSDEVTRLRADVARLEGELQTLRTEFNRVEFLYRSESLINMELQDLLRAHRIPFRSAIAQYAER